VQLDTQTLVVTAIVVALVPAFMGAMVWHSIRTYPGRWALGNVMAVAALMLLRLRDIVPDWLSIVIANGLMMATGIAYLQGIRRFRGLRITWWPECCVGAIGVLGVAYFRYVSNNINARILVISIVLGCIGSACGRTLLLGMPRRRRVAYLLTGTAFLLGSAVHFTRGIYTFAYAPVHDLFDRAPSNTIFFVLVAAGSLSWSFGFVLLTSEWLDKSEAVILYKQVATQEKPLPDFIPEVDIRRQLGRILDSAAFRRSPQMARFLTVVVDRSLLGRHEELKEYLLGRDVFQRGEDYDPRSDSIVRVEVQRLRRKLREYYETQGAEDAILIDLPAGGYVPQFRYADMDVPGKMKQRSI
jgi:hypothetical protein